MKEGTELCSHIKSQLEKIQSVNDIKEIHCDMYRILAKLLPTISGKAFETYLPNRQIEEALIKRKKNGVLGALVIDDLYVYRNQTSSTKNERVYFVFQHIINQKNIVLLGAIDGAFFETRDQAEDCCKSIVQTIRGNTTL